MKAYYFIAQIVALFSVAINSSHAQEYKLKAIDLFVANVDRDKSLFKEYCHIDTTYEDAEGIRNFYDNTIITWTDTVKKRAKKISWNPDGKKLIQATFYFESNKAVKAIIKGKILRSDTNPCSLETNTVIYFADDKVIYQKDYLRNKCKTAPNPSWYLLTIYDLIKMGKIRLN
jgi:hypothetical protein